MSIGLRSSTDGVSGAIQVNGNDVVGFNTSGLTLGMRSNLPVYGSELVTTTSNTITLPGSAFTQNISVVAGTRYRIRWTQTNSIADNGALTITLGSVSGGLHVYRTVTTASYMEVVLTAATTGSVALALTPTSYTGTGTITITGLSCIPVTSSIPAFWTEKDSLGNIQVEHRITYGGYNSASIGTGINVLSINQQDGIGGTNMAGAVTTISGVNNTASGVSALNNNTTGYNNTASGVYALQNNTTGYQNTASGVAALQYNTTGYNNTASGVSALQNNTTGYYNTASGSVALQNNTTGYYNTASGVSALQNNTTGYYNTASGSVALQNNTTGYQNSSFGSLALQNNTTGFSNSAFGYYALYSNTTFSDCSGLGYNAQVTASSQIQLGDSATTTYVYGTVQNRSDLRDKADVRDTVLGLDFIKSLRPVDYKWDMRDYYAPEAPVQGDLSDEEFKIVQEEWLEAVKQDNIVHDGSKKRLRYHHGLIAQEVEEVIKSSGVDFGGFQDHKLSGGHDVLSIGYDELIAPMIKAIQELSAQNLALIARIAVLEAK